MASRISSRIIVFRPDTILATISVSGRLSAACGPGRTSELFICTPKKALFPCHWHPTPGDVIRESERDQNQKPKQRAAYYQSDQNLFEKTMHQHERQNGRLHGRDNQADEHIHPTHVKECQKHV